MTDPLAATTVERMVRLVEPEWRLRASEPVEAGFSAVYRVRIETANGMRTRYLKTAVDGMGGGISADARVSTLLDERTDIPVPHVVGVVDGHDDLPSPFHLTVPMPGDELAYEAVGWADNKLLRQVARDVGRHLGRLHTVEAVDSFGYVDSAGPELVGERPAGTPAELAVVRGDDDWPTYLKRRFDAGLDENAGSRFSELTDRLTAWVDARLERLDGPFVPTLCRNDHGLHNLLLDAETGAVAGVPDWAYTLATPPDLDFEFAVYIYGGSYLAGLPGVRDRRGFVREAMLDGYRATAPRDFATAVAEPEPCYEMLARLRIMNHFEGLRLPPGGKPQAAAGVRTEVENALEAYS
jgi:aminoglycoside phosphotransferase (APT) family kinase protein